LRRRRCAYVTRIARRQTRHPQNVEALTRTEISRGGCADSGERLCTSPRDRQVKVWRDPFSLAHGSFVPASD